MHEDYIIKITKMYQKRTTIPKEVRDELKLKNGDEIVWKKQKGLITLTRKRKIVFKYG